ncbi:olfactory receptor 1361-like [Ornithorhynchus anatinus]|uniref:olfactory receptor 1361-like n=1 Tax=Ornithorhynchus anatinus TaxID=9258 RepID=UPI0010A808E7|nr:olfactory receptor 1361-like [Ornithorhynchus anatinus]
MGSENKTGASGFILLGLSSDSEQQRLLLVLFLTLYLVTVGGNLLIVLAIGTDSHLQSPMYFFLANLSLVDVCFSSTTVPKMLTNMQTSSPAISYVGCLSQLYFFLIFSDLDNLLLAVMAYDRFMAICRPLDYATAMGPQRCVLLVAACWVITNLISLLHTILVTKLSFCADRTIPHFFCDLAPLLQLSCSDTSVNELVVLIVGGSSIAIPFTLILISYIRIIAAVLRVPSARGRFKAFSTCGSHLAVVSLFYGTIVAVYFLPSSTQSPGKDSVAAVLYAVVTPLLNPFIYSLRNRDLHGALRRALCSWNLAPAL